jgi:plasmid stability protein
MQQSEVPIAMSSITIRNLDPAIKERLRIRAAQHGHSMEAEARRILADATAAERPPEVDLAEAIRRRFATFGGVELDLLPRTPDRDPPRFD